MISSDLHNHKISKFSPLKLDIYGGYKLLSLIASIKLDSVQPLVLPTFEDYLSDPYYSSVLLHDAHSLSFLIETNAESLENAFDCVEEFSKSMFQIKSSIDSHLSNNFHLYQKTIHTIARQDLVFADFHCNECRTKINYFLNLNISDDNFLNFSDSILHGDLHGSNLLSNGDVFKVIDFENIHFGPAYSDVVLFSMLVPGAYAHLKKVLVNMQSIIQRDISFFSDVRHSLCIALIQYVRATADIKKEVMNSIHHTLIELSEIDLVSGEK